MITKEDIDEHFKYIPKELVLELLKERDAYREVAISRYDPNHTSCSESDECRCSPLDAERSIDAEAQKLMGDK